MPAVLLGQIPNQVDHHRDVLAERIRPSANDLGLDADLGPVGLDQLCHAAGVGVVGPLDGHGGSTITQQVAKLLCLGVPYDPDTWKDEAAYEADCRAGSLWRKIKEIPYAFALEARYSKNEILTIYLNRAYLGAGSRGFEAAAQRYFDLENYVQVTLYLESMKGGG